MPEVSVIIPTYNRCELLKRAIRSVLEQTFNDYEIIIIDDCSTDNTKQVVQDFNDKRITYFKMPKNSGGSIRPRQIGLGIASGEYIAVLDDDDYWADKEKLLLQVNWLNQHPKCVMVGTNAIAVNKGLTIVARHHYPQSFEEIKQKMLMQNCFFHSSVMYRKESVAKIGGYPKVIGGFYNNFVDEYEMWLKMGLIGELINLPIYGIGYTYTRKPLSMKNRIDFLVRHLKHINNYKEYYPHFLKAYLFNIIITIFELPILLNIKKIIRRY